MTPALSSPDPDPEPDSILHTTSPTGITHIKLNRPHARNAINPPTALKLYNAFQAFNTDPTQHICILSGTHGTFCSGYDLKHLASSSTSTSTSTASPPHYGAVANETIAPMGPSRILPTKPVIAVIQGHAVAGGLELSLLADIRVAETDAVFGVF